MSGVLIGLIVSRSAETNYLLLISPWGRRTEAIGMYSVFGTAATGFSGLIGDFLVSKFGYTDQLFSLLSHGIACTTAISIVLALLNSRANHQVQITEAREMDPTSLKPCRPGFPTGIVFSALVSGIIIVLSTTFIVPIAEHFSITYVSSYYISFSIFIVLSRLALRKMNERFSMNFTLRSAHLLLILYGVLLVFCRNQTALAVAGALCGAALGLISPIVIVEIADWARKRFPVAGAGMAQFIVDCGRSVGGPVIGIALSRFGVEAVSILVCVMSGVAGILVSRIRN